MLFTADGLLLDQFPFDSAGTIRFSRDWVTGVPYVIVYEEGEKTRLYSENGTRLFAEAGYSGSRLAAGALCVNAESFSGLLSPEGDWIFRWPLPVGEWD